MEWGTLLLVLLILIVLAVLVWRLRSGGDAHAVYADNLEAASRDNADYRRVVHTDPHQQLVLMSLQPGEEIGREQHSDTTQFIRVEQGRGFADVAGQRYALRDGSALVIPPGTWHNIGNDTQEPLKLYTIYSPPEHAPGTVQPRKPIE